MSFVEYTRSDCFVPCGHSFLLRVRSMSVSRHSTSPVRDVFGVCVYVCEEVLHVQFMPYGLTLRVRMWGCRFRLCGILFRWQTHAGWRNNNRGAGNDDNSGARVTEYHFRNDGSVFLHLVRSAASSEHIPPHAVANMLYTEDTLAEV